MEALYQPSSGAFPQIQWDFLVLLSDVCLNFQGPGLLENVEPRVQQSSVTVSDNHDSRVLCCFISVVLPLLFPFWICTGSGLFFGDLDHTWEWEEISSGWAMLRFLKVLPQKDSSKPFNPTVDLVTWVDREAAILWQVPTIRSSWSTHWETCTTKELSLWKYYLFSLYPEGVGAMI